MEPKNNICVYSYICNQSGNALWLILLAVALLGILAAAVTRNNSSINQSGSVEQARIKASSLLRYSRSVENVIQKMLIDGISENDLDFIAIGTNHDNTNCNKPECEVFNVKGGGLEYINVANLINDSNHQEDWIVSSENRVYQFGCDNNSAECTELLLLAKDIPKEICLQINKIQNIANPNNDAPRQSEILDDTAFTGTYGANINSVFIGGTNATNESPQTKNKSAGCVFEFGGSQNTYHFYKILISR